MIIFAFSPENVLMARMEKGLIYLLASVLNDGHLLCSIIIQ